MKLIGLEEFFRHEECAAFVYAHKTSERFSDDYLKKKKKKEQNLLFVNAYI